MAKETLKRLVLHFGKHSRIICFHAELVILAQHIGWRHGETAIPWLYPKVTKGTATADYIQATNKAPLIQC